MGLPSSNRVTLAVLLNLYIVPRRPPSDDDPAAGTTASTTPPTPRDGPVMEGLTEYYQGLSTLPSAQTTALAIFILEEMESLGGQVCEKPFALLLENLTEACGGGGGPQT